MSHVIRFWLILFGTVLKQWFLPETLSFQASGEEESADYQSLYF